MIKFDVGSKVMLKSGGPTMEVIEVIDDKRICQWEGAVGPEKHDFNVVCLTAAQEV